MANRKPISVNLRDLQRVLNEGKPELPRFSRAAEEEGEEDAGPTTYRAPRTRPTDSRWFNENDEDDEDTRDRRGDREELPEPDFSTVRTTANEFKRISTENQSLGRFNTGESPSRAEDDDVWRSSRVTSNREPSPEDDVWRRPAGNREKGVSDSNDTAPVRKTESFGRDVDDDDMFRRSNNQTEISAKKLYVPPTRRNETGGDFAARSDRFSCLEESYERRGSSSIFNETSRAREVFSMQRREAESQRDYHAAREAFSSNNRERDHTRNVHFQEPRKTGLFVPSYRRTQTAPSANNVKPASVHDIFLKAAGIAEKSEPEQKKPQPESESPKATQNTAELQMKQKTEAILRHNRIYSVNPDTLKNLEAPILSMLKGQNVAVVGLVPEDEEELVPAVLTCLLACKACENCSSMQEVKTVFDKVSPLLKELCKRAEEPIEEKLLTEVAKIMNHWKLPALSDSVYLIEAVFDALLQCGVVTKKSVLHWLEDTAEEVPDRVSVILQLLTWKKWLLGESLQAPEEPSETESEESEEDIDIEALVPKPIQLTKTMMY